MDPIDRIHRPGREAASLNEAVASPSGAQTRAFAPMHLGGACVVALCIGWGHAAQAQEEPAAQPNPLEEVTVTGSRLRRDGMSTPTPVTAVDSEQLSNMAPTMLMDALVQLPQFRGNDLSHTGGIFDTGGAQALNLRGIGSNRTLVLLDGRRIVGSSQRGAVDIAVFPQALVERVEVVTGGASAAYGSDAVSGVANFILDTDYVGVNGSFQGGMTDRRDHDNYQLELAGGMELGERAHVIASVDYYQADAVVGYEDRDWFQSYAMIDNPDPNGPQRIIGRPAYSRSVTMGGVIPSGPLAGTQFLDGVPVPVRDGGVVSGPVQFGGSGFDPAVRYGELRPEERRHSAFAHLKYDFSDSLEGYVQVLRGHHAIESTPGVGTGFAGGWAMTIYQDNPFLPESLRQRMQDEGIESFPFQRAWQEVDSPSRHITSDTTSVTLGLDGEAGNVTFGGYYQYGENVQVADYASNNRGVRTDRLYRSVDSAIHPETNEIVCRSSIEGIGLTPEEEAATTKLNPFGLEIHGDPLSNSECVPVDPFGSPSEAAQQYLHSGVYHRQRVRQHFLELTAQTEFDGLQAGPISFGGGLAYREESVYQAAFGNASDPRNLAQFGVFGEEVGIRGVPAFVQDRGVFVTGNPNNEGPIGGEFDVWEVFAESIVPLYSGDNGRALDMHLAVRYADYAGSGGVWAAKFGQDWQVNDQLRFRGTYSRDTRAGTLSERFDTQTGGADIDDPLLPDMPPYRAALTVGGNPEVQPELADTVTLGMVYQPAWADGLSLSLDVYDIQIEDAISQLGAQEIVDGCFAGADDLCALVTRSAGSQTIVEIYDVFINIAEARTRGVDLELSYQRPITLFGGGGETLTFRGFANYLDEVSEQLVGSPVINEAGQRDYPEWLGTGSVTYSNGPFELYWQTRYIDSSVRDVRWTSGIDIDNNEVSSATYSNVQFTYDMEVGAGTGQLFFHVSNLFDEDPPLTPGGVSTTNGMTTHTLDSMFDTLGRSYNAGFRFRFE